jgi:hypothetical protein
MGWYFLELDPAPEARDHLIRRFLEALRERGHAPPDRFGTFLGLSFLAHLVLFGILLAMAGAPEVTPADAYYANSRAFSLALEQMGQTPGHVQLALSGSPKGKEKGLEEDIGSLFRFDKDISESDKVHFFRSILEAGGIFDANGRVDTEAGAFFIAQAASGNAYEVDKIDRSTLEEMARIAANVEGTQDGARSAEAADTALAMAGPADVPREYLVRDCPYAEILARGARLFTVFDGFPDLEDEEDRHLPPAGDRDGARPPKIVSPPSQAGVILLSVGHSVASRPLPILNQSPAERLRIIDELMSLNEPDQLEAFKTQYLDVYDPDRGDLAALAREFFYDNLNGVFIVTDPATTAFDAVEGIFLKRPVYETYARYGRRLRGSRTGAALLLNLASTYGFERRTLAALAEAGGEARWITATPTTIPWQHQPRLKAFIVDRLSREVIDLAARMDLSIGDLSGIYLQRQEAIYRRLTGLGGDIMNRALFDWGRLDWELGRHPEAIKKWKRADRTCALSPRAFRSILEIISRHDVTRSPQGLASIGQILLSSESLDKQDLLTRYLKYGTWKKRAF